MSHPADSPVVISGSGLSGACCALLLANAGIPVYLLEAKPPPSPPDRDHPATLALNHSSYNVLYQLGITLTTPDYGNCTDIHVWDTDGNGQIQFHRTEANLPWLAKIVHAQTLQSHLHRQLSTHPNIVFLHDTHISQIERTNPCKDTFAIHLSNAEPLQTPLLIGADGTNSIVRKLGALDYSLRDYHQHTLVTTVELATPHHHCARQHFCRDQIIALLPLANDHRASLLWSAASTYAEQLQQMPTQQFNHTLSEKFFDMKADTLQVCAPRLCWRLRYGHAPHYYQSRLVLIGDAAHSIHPLAGQGGNLGILDATCLAEILIQAWHGGKDIGKRKVLGRYERRRRYDNLLMTSTINGLKSIFASDLAGIYPLRQTGMRWLNHRRWLKGLVIRHATGSSKPHPIAR